MVVLDAGALVAVERGSSPLVRDLQRLALRGAVRLVVSSGVVGQVWRNPARQVRLVRLLRTHVVSEVALDPPDARSVGQRLARGEQSDVVDAHVALLSERYDARSIVTSDPDDLVALGVARDRLLVV